jgi:hypothetical protein
LAGAMKQFGKAIVTVERWHVVSSMAMYAGRYWVEIVVEGLHHGGLLAVIDDFGNLVGVER